MKLKTILKSMLEDKGLSITDLSKATKVPVQTLHNWLNGVEPRSLKQVKTVANYFSLTLDEICYGPVKIEKNIEEYTEEINAGVFEVVLRRIKK